MSNKTPYQETVHQTYTEGKDYPDRTGKGRRRKFGAMERYSLKGNTLPADTTTQLFLKTLTYEIIGFKDGSTNIKDLGEHFWRRWSPTKEDVEAHVKLIAHVETLNNEDESVAAFYADPANLEAMAKSLEHHIDTIGPMYGSMWRNFPRVNRERLLWVSGFEDIPSDKVATYKDLFASEIVRNQSPERNTKEEFEAFALAMFTQSFDQLAMVMKGLKENPYSSRHRITAFHPDTTGVETLSPVQNVLAGKAALTPCHSHMQFYVGDTDDGKKELSCMFYMSSSDVMIGRPYNICQYALLTMMIAHCLDMEPGELAIVSCDTHIYLHHLDKVEEQLARDPLPYPTVTFPADKKDLFAFTADDIKINGYQHHPKIVYEVAV